MRREGVHFFSYCSFAVRRLFQLTSPCISRMVVSGGRMALSADGMPDMKKRILVLWIGLVAVAGGLAAFASGDADSVPNARKAEHLAIQAYLAKMGGIRAREGFHCSGVLLLGFPVEGFAQEGDEVWEVRMSGMNGNRPENTLRAILWVHPDTGKVYYVCGPWRQGGAESSTFEPPKATVEHGTGE